MVVGHYMHTTYRARVFLVERAGGDATNRYSLNNSVFLSCTRSTSLSKRCCEDLPIRAVPLNVERLSVG
jgi:hypothetical protein